MAHDSITSLAEIRKLATYQAWSNAKPLYAIIVIGEKLRSDLDGSELSTLIYPFLVPPSTIDLGEPSASEVVPTQDGGIYVESQGQLLKDLTVEGTTGFRPLDSGHFQGRSGFTGNIQASAKGFGNALADAFNRTAVTRGHLPENARMTGAELHVKLRNVFRSYWEAKADSSRASKTLMLWGNLREQEVYVIEPTRFRTRRDSSNPFTYRYEIEARTLMPIFKAAQGSADFLQAYFPAVNDPHGFGHFSAFINHANNIARQGSALVAAAEDTLTRFPKLIEESARSVLRLVSVFTEAANAVARGATRRALMPVNILGAIRETGLRLLAVEESFEAAGVQIEMGWEREDWNVWKKLLIWGARASVLARSGEFRAGSSRHGSTDAKAKEMAKPYKGTFQIGDASETTNYQRPSDVSPTSAPSPFEGAFDAGSKMTLGAVNPGLATEQTRVSDYETLADIAMRTMGSRAHAKLLAIHNNLRPPYISRDGDGESVLRPGDVIRYPRRISPNRGRRNMTISTLREINDRMGVDIAIGENLNDIEVDARGDLARVSGFNNLRQAVRIKFFTEQGELPLYPWFGIRLPIGERMLGPEFLSLFVFNARMTLVSDPRIDSTSGVDVAVEGDTARVRGTIKVADSDQTVVFDQPMRGSA